MLARVLAHITYMGNVTTQDDGESANRPRGVAPNGKQSHAA